MSSRAYFHHDVLRAIGSGSSRVLRTDTAPVYLYTDTNRTILATLYSTENGNTTLTNPLVPDSTGEVSAWVQSGRMYYGKVETETFSWFSGTDTFDSITSLGTIIGQMLDTGGMVVHVKNYGAIGGTGADMYTAINNAALAASAFGGGTVQLGYGVYNLSHYLVFYSNVKYRGLGKLATTARLIDSSGQFYVMANNLAGAQNVGFEDMTLDVNGATNRSANGAGFLGCLGVRVNNFRVQGLWHNNVSGCNSIKMISAGDAGDAAGENYYIGNGDIVLNHAVGPGAIYIGSSAGAIHAVTNAIIENIFIDASAVDNTEATTGFAIGVCVDMKDPSSRDPNRISSKISIRNIFGKGLTAALVGLFGHIADVDVDSCWAVGTRNGRHTDGTTVLTPFGYFSSVYPNYAANVTWWDFSGSGLSANPTYSINHVFRNCHYIDPVDTSSYGFAVSDGGYTTGSVARGVKFENCYGRGGAGMYLDGIGTKALGCYMEGSGTGNGKAGYYIPATAQYPVIDDCTTYGHQYGVQAAVGAIGVIVSNSLFEGCGTRISASGVVCRIVNVPNVANVLYDGLTVSGAVNVSGVVQSITSGQSYVTAVSGDTQFRAVITGPGVVQFSGGTGSLDTNIYRRAAGELKTDGKIEAVGGLGVGNSASATTPGSVVKKMQVFDASGASLGYVAIYDAIT